MNDILTTSERAEAAIAAAARERDCKTGQPAHMTGVVTERRDIKLRLPNLEEMCSVCDFISFKDLMGELGVPYELYRDSKLKLRNGTIVRAEDPQLGWGRDGFGYYLMTFIGVG